ncbi:AAA family ATPase [Edaphobacter paludis]|uniref:AAA family ATPase n=1 Tax=Edaphobacter paludis TaxID=3035702 RepID=A0AAU7D761_9BACT
MNIQDVRIERFRSAELVQLKNVNDFNVLIGKNNSGKSTALFAIEAFFQCLGGEGLVSLAPPFGRKIDFYKQILDQPIIISLAFALDEEERRILLQEIAREAPQLKNVIDAIDSSLLIEISVAVTALPDNYAYVKSIKFSGTEGSAAEPSRTLLNVNAVAAQELVARQRAISASNQSVNDISRFLETFDSDDFTRIKKDEDDTRAFLRFRVAGRRSLIEMSSRSLQEIEQILRSSDSYLQFRTTATAYRNQLVSESKKNASEPLKNFLQTFSGEQSTAPTYALDLLHRVVNTRRLFLAERREPVGRVEAKQLLDYKVTRGGPETLKDIQQKIEGLLGVKVDAFESRANESNERTAEMDVDNFLLEVNGSGVKEALRLILDVELKKPTLLLVEEPEVHLHPALETNMMRYLREVSQSCQVFVSTHSTNFLDLAGTQNVYFVSKKTSASEIKLLEIGEAERQIPEDLGIRLSSLFMFDRLVFVEGLSDELVLREFAARLKIDLSQANVGFIHIGGSRNFSYFANEATFSFLSKRQVKSTFVLDKDERDDAEILKMKASLGERASLHMLSRRELENFMVKSRPLKEFIIFKRAVSGIKPDAEITDEVVTAALLRSADQLRPLSTMKRATHSILNSIHVAVEWTAEDVLDQAQGKILGEIVRLREQLTAQEAAIGPVLEQSRRFVDGNWKSQWINLVLGDILLDKTCQQFGVRFKKVTDGPKLASFYEANEIEGEIATLLKSFGAGA